MTGLEAGKTLQLGLQRSGGSSTTITVSADGAFVFDPVKLAAGETYVVSVVTQPTEQTCSITNGSGTMVNANVTSVAVACVATTTTYSVGGTIVGLDGDGLKIENGAANAVTPAAGATTSHCPSNSKAVTFTTSASLPNPRARPV